MVTKMALEMQSAAGAGTPSGAEIKTLADPALAAPRSGVKAASPKPPEEVARLLAERVSSGLRDLPLSRLPEKITHAVAMLKSRLYSGALTLDAFHNALLDGARANAERDVESGEQIVIEALKRLGIDLPKLSPRREPTKEERLKNVELVMRELLARAKAGDNNARPELERLAAERKRLQQPDPLPEGYEDFVAYLPAGNFIFLPVGDFWASSGVNAKLKPQLDGQDEKGKPKFISASNWLLRNRRVEQMTWAPGEPQLIEGRLMGRGSWISKPGCITLNQYRPPLQRKGDPAQAKRWTDHLRRVYPNEAEHILDFFAHRTQKPGEKICHALMLGGRQGVGKDTILAPLRHAIGSWNFEDIKPAVILERFNKHLKSVVLRINEIHDLGDINRFSFYETMKDIIAAPPEVHRIDEKHQPQYYIPNVCAVIMTTNHQTQGLYLPEDDRRHFVAWSSLTKADFEGGYWAGIWDYYSAGGFDHVASYLRTRDISSFDAKAPPPQTDAFRQIVAAGRVPEDDDVADALEQLGRPKAVTIERLVATADISTSAWLTDRRNRTKIRHRMEAAGYTAALNPDDKEGRWRVNGPKRVIYARTDMSERERLDAARAIASASHPPNAEKF